MDKNERDSRKHLAEVINEYRTGIYVHSESFYMSIHIKQRKETKQNGFRDCVPLDKYRRLQKNLEKEWRQGKRMSL
jgi:hypothetical protein